MMVMYVCMQNETTGKRNIFCNSSSNRFMYRLTYKLMLNIKINKLVGWFGFMAYQPL